MTIEYDEVPLNTTPWQNQQNNLDVTGDGEIVPRDVLFIVNYINSNGPGPLPAPDANQPPPFYDVTGDNEITARDALLIINFINAQGNGEPGTDVDALFALSLLDDDE